MVHTSREMQKIFTSLIFDIFIKIMPTILRIGGYRLFFFSNEGNEPIHIHVESGDGYCKYWLNPTILAYSTGYNSSELNRIKKIVEEHSTKIKNSWNEHFSQT